MIKQAAILHNGILYQGRRHKDIRGSNIFLDNKNGEEGFVTTSGQFVNREEAAKIALMCGQIKRPKKKLISEDLY